MKPTVKTFIIIFTYISVCFLGCLILGFCLNESNFNHLLPHHIGIARFLKGLTFFCDIFPSICACGALFGLAWSFNTKVGNLKRYSRIQLGNLKRVLFVSFISTFMCFITSEVVYPLVNQKQTKIENEIQNYVDFYYFANEYKALGNYNLAKFYVENALKLHPTSPAAKALANEIEYLSTDVEKTEYDFSNEIAKYVANINVTQKTPEDEISHLLDTAKSHYVNNDFFNAHYYAIQAQYLTKEGSLNHQTAMNIAADAWNKISNTENQYDKELAALYAEKKRGYVALLEEDFIKSYYIFNDLIDKGYNDKDIVFYKDVAEQGLLNITFFTDESETLRKFESSRDIYFTLNHSDGSKDVIYIRGITILDDAGQFVQYFRNFLLSRYSKDGKFQKSIFTPYAKMIAIPASSLGKSVENTNIKKDGYVPYVLLSSVDRYSSSNQVLPTYTFAYDYPNEIEERAIVLEMPYEDINLIRQASKGAEQMPIPALFQFSEKASSYGYSSAIYSCSLAYRISFPLFMMICYIIVGLFAWNYRLMPGRPIKFRWYLTFPVFQLIIYLIFHVLTYFGNIFFFTLFGAIGTKAIFVAPIILTFGILWAALAYTSLRGE